LEYLGTSTNSYQFRTYTPRIKNPVSTSTFLV
jgi:hypothetical protein